VIKDVPPKMVPGLDGFIGILYKRCWTNVKEDMTQAILSFCSHRRARLNIVLLRKSQDASSLSDYRPISLINRIAKTITKILKNKLAPHIHSLVSNTQNAFIKKRCIESHLAPT
jgi:hypothetical protein